MVNEQQQKEFLPDREPRSDDKMLDDGATVSCFKICYPPGF